VCSSWYSYLLSEKTHRANPENIILADSGHGKYYYYVTKSLSETFGIIFLLLRIISNKLKS
jgi:hypothetical protein